jgi:hypothetical protein
MIGAQKSTVRLAAYPLGQRDQRAVLLGPRGQVAHLVAGAVMRKPSGPWRTLCGESVQGDWSGTPGASAILCRRCHYRAEEQVIPARTRASQLEAGHVVLVACYWYELLEKPVPVRPDSKRMWIAPGLSTSRTRRQLALINDPIGYRRRPMLHLP